VEKQQNRRKQPSSLQLRDYRAKGELIDIVLTGRQRWVNWSEEVYDFLHVIRL